MLDKVREMGVRGGMRGGRVRFGTCEGKGRRRV